MDPNTCLHRIHDALATGNRGDAAEAVEDLRGWLRRGGFEPDWDRFPEASAFCARQRLIAFYRSPEARHG